MIVSTRLLTLCKSIHWLPVLGVGLLVGSSDLALAQPRQAPGDPTQQGTGAAGAQQQQGQPAPAQPAQQTSQPPPAAQGDQPAQQPQQGQAGQRPAAEPIEGTGVTQRDYMADERRPAPPATPRKPGDPDQLELTRGAGVGSPLGYARATVVELGGVMALTHRSQTTEFRIAPSIGYFFIDSLELTIFPELQISDVDGNSDFRIAGLLEPSYHIALSESEVFGFAGIGVGLSYSDDPGVDLFFRPRLGLDIMIGRSGILKPAAFLDVGANDGLTSGGLEAGFTVMW
jgi:hypothetical protein